MLTLLVFVIRIRELQQFDLLFWNQSVSVSSNWVMFFFFLMFYLLHLWIWFNIKLHISYEAVRWKLCLRHLLCPTALTLLAEASPPTQGGVPLGWRWVMPSRSHMPAGAFCAFCSLSNHCCISSMLCSIPSSHLLHWKALNYLKLKKNLQKPPT